MRLVLFQPDIPQNVGAAIRTAACFGTSLDIIEPCGFPLKSKEIARVAMDYGALAQPRAFRSWEAFQNEREPGRVILLTTKGAGPLWDFEFHEDDALLLGRESAGVPDDVHNTVDARLFIPMAKGARSLNVVVAGAVALGEAQRQLAK